MKSAGCCPSKATHFVADPKNCYFFESVAETLTANVQSQLKTFFNIISKSHSDLLNLVTGVLKHNPNARQDLLYGCVNWKNNKFRINNNDGVVGFEPRTSTMIYEVSSLLGKMSCEQMLLFPGTWVTNFSEMSRTLPASMYHGTSNKYLTEIENEGLIAGGEPNWNVDIPNRIYFTASPYIAANHAARTAGMKGGQPIVVEFNCPTVLCADFDVEREILLNPLNPTRGNSDFWGQEAGLWSTCNPIIATEITKFYIPKINCPFDHW